MRSTECHRVVTNSALIFPPAPETPEHLGKAHVGASVGSGTLGRRNVTGAIVDVTDWVSGRPGSDLPPGRSRRVIVHSGHSGRCLSTHFLPFICSSRCSFECLPSSDPSHRWLAPSRRQAISAPNQGRRVEARRSVRSPFRWHRPDGRRHRVRGRARPEPVDGRPGSSWPLQASGATPRLALPVRLGARPRGVPSRR